MRRLLILPLLLACSSGWGEPHRTPPPGLPDPLSAGARILSPEFAAGLTAAAIERTRRKVRYDGSYIRIGYPMGDVPDGIGVCTDVVIRSYRAVGIDLQREVHEDMRENFSAYPRTWGLKRPDSSIDHRRVPNLETFFSRRGLEVRASRVPAAYLPGDLVTWTVGGGRPHIGIVVGEFSADGKRPLVVHNIGWGPKMEDVLFAYPIAGHFRFAGRAPHH